METKTHFKMYKDGKRWVVSGITAMALGLGLAGYLPTANVEADTSDDTVQHVAASGTNSNDAISLHSASATLTSSAQPENSQSSTSSAAPASSMVSASSSSASTEHTSSSATDSLYESATSNFVESVSSSTASDAVFGGATSNSGSDSLNSKTNSSFANSDATAVTTKSSNAVKPVQTNFLVSDTEQSGSNTATLDPQIDWNTDWALQDLKRYQGTYTTQITQIAPKQIIGTMAFTTVPRSDANVQTHFSLKSLALEAYGRGGVDLATPVTSIIINPIANPTEQQTFTQLVNSQTISIPKGQIVESSSDNVAYKFTINYSSTAVVDSAQVTASIFPPDSAYLVRTYYKKMNGDDIQPYTIGNVIKDSNQPTLDSKVGDFGDTVTSDAKISNLPIGYYLKAAQQYVLSPTDTNPQVTDVKISDLSNYTLTSTMNVNEQANVFWYSNAVSARVFYKNQTGMYLSTDGKFDIPENQVPEAGDQMPSDSRLKFDTLSGEAGASYTSTSLTDDELPEYYQLAVTPTNADGKFTSTAAAIDKPGITENVVYEYKPYEKATVTYIDDTTGKTIKTDTLQGKDGTTPQYSTTAEINGLKSKGFELVNDGYPGGSFEFDTDVTTDQVFEVHLKHVTTTVTPETPGVPGDPIDPDTPGTPVWPAGSDKNSLQKTVSQTIKYFYNKVDGTPAALDAVQIVTFTRSGEVDHVTGKITLQPWMPVTVSFSDTNSPEIIGYTADQKTVPERDGITVTATNTVVNVIYTANKEVAKVSYYDDTNNSLLTSKDLTGQFGTTDSYRTADTNTYFIGKGYKVVSDNYPVNGVVYNDKDQSFEVHLVHKTAGVTTTTPGNPGEPIVPGNPQTVWPKGSDKDSLTKTIRETVRYIYADKKTAAPEKDDQVEFTKSGVVDYVTGVVTYNAWMPTTGTSFSKKDSPDVSGYLPDKSSIAEVDNLTANSQDINETVTYRALPSLIPQSPDPKFPTPGIETYPNNPDNPSKPGTLLVPDVPGYTPQTPAGKPLVPGSSITPDTPTNPNDPYPNTIIDYVPKTETASVIYQDLSTNTILKTDSLEGKFNTTDTSYKTAPEITTLENQGYKLVKDGFPSTGVVYDKDQPQIFYVQLTHATSPVTTTTPGKPGQPINPNDTNPNKPNWPEGSDKQGLTKVVSEIVHYVYSDGSVAANDKTAQVEFTRTGTVDRVTGVVTYVPWIATNNVTQFDQQDSPVITGFLADKKTVPAVTGLTVASPNVVETVVYTKLGSVVPVSSDPNFPKTPSTVYPNDPGDPTKPGIVTVPNVPGYTPQTPDGMKLVPNTPLTPKTPSTDTPIVYVANDERANVTYHDDEAKKVLQTSALSGKFNTTATYRTQPTIDGYLQQGYKLVSDNYPTDGVTYDKDGVVQQFDVHLTHDVEPVSPDNPGQPGQPVNPFDPHTDRPNWPAGSDKDSLRKIVNETIHYVYKDGKPVFNDHTDQIEFTKSGTIDKVTGVVTYNPWTATKGNGFGVTQSPAKVGFLPDKKAVGPYNNLTQNSGNIVETVTYSPDVVVASQGKVEVVYQDDVNGKTIDSASLAGETNTPVKYQTAATINKYILKGYKLFKDNYPTGNVTFDKGTQTFVVHFTHATQSVTTTMPGQPNEPINPNDSDGNGPKWPNGSDKAGLTKTVTETVHYVYEDKTKAADDKTDQVTFTRSGVIDKVTGVITYQPWTATNGNTTFSEKDSPVIKGYLADQKSIDKVTGLTETSANVIDTVTYRSLGSLIPNSPDPKFPKIPSTVYPNDPQNPSEPGIVIVPNVPGYTPQTPAGNPLVPGKPITPMTPFTNTPITYVANDETATVTYIDDVTGQNLEKPTSLSGQFNQAATYKTQPTIDGYLAKGFTLVSDNYPTDGMIFNKDGVKQTYEVHLTHGVKPFDPQTPGNPGKPVDPNKPTGPSWPNGSDENSLTKVVTETIHYVFKNGKTASADKTDRVEFTRSGSVDTVTGVATFKNWTATNGTSFSAKQSPVIEGFYADQAEIAAVNNLTQDSANIVDTVVYQPVGKLTPDVPGTPSVSYPNVPGQPDKVGQPLIPDIPGYTPVDPNGKPLTPGTPYPVDPSQPGRDTPLHYVKKVVTPPDNGTTTPITPQLTITTPVTPKGNVPDGKTSTEPNTPVKPAGKVSVTTTPTSENVATPVTPVNTATATLTNHPATQTAPASKTTTLPKTGESTNRLLVVTGEVLLGLLAIGASLGSVRRSKRFKK